MTTRWLTLLAALPVTAAALSAQKLQETPQNLTPEQMEARLHYRTGHVKLRGGLATPRYDAATHKLYWAKDLHFGTEPVHTLNYNIRVLGRRGVLVLNAVATMDQLATVRRDMGKVIAFVDFAEGNRYADFVPGTDKVAEYGIAALIAGSIAAKAGFFKLLLAGIIALKKLIVVALVAIGAFFKRIFGKKKEAPAAS